MDNNGLLESLRRLQLSIPSVPVQTTVAPILQPIVNPAELVCPKSRYGHELTPSRCGSSQDCSKRGCSLCGWNRPFLLIKCGCLTHYCRYSIIPIDSSHHLFRYTPCLECGKKRPECEQYWPYRATIPACDHDFRPRISNDHHRVNQGFYPCTKCNAPYTGLFAC